MLPTFLLLLLVSLFACPVLAVAQPSSPTSRIIVMGSVFCDVCYNNSFTRFSYFLPGVDVQVQCKFQANEPRTAEKLTFSVNRTTDRYGVYRLDIPSMEGIDCVEGPAFESFCEASLIRSAVAGCNVPGVSTTSKEITVKSRSTNLCVYSVSALTYRPFNKNSTLCENNKVMMEEDQLLSDSYKYNSSKYFLPYFPWPLPQFPPWPALPPLPPLPPLPSLPPFLSLPPFPSFPPFQFPPLPPAPPFSRPPVDPRTWIPNIPLSSPPPPPFNPFPPPPTFDLRDPRTWIPTFPPSPNSPQSKEP